MKSAPDLISGQEFSSMTFNLTQHEAFLHEEKTTNRKRFCRQIRGKND